MNNKKNKAMTTAKLKSYIFSAIDNEHSRTLELKETRMNDFGLDWIGLLNALRHTYTRAEPYTV